MFPLTLLPLLTSLPLTTALHPLILDDPDCPITFYIPPPHFHLAAYPPSDPSDPVWLRTTANSSSLTGDNSTTKLEASTFSYSYADARFTTNVSDTKYTSLAPTRGQPLNFTKEAPADGGSGKIGAFTCGCVGQGFAVVGRAESGSVGVLNPWALCQVADATELRYVGGDSTGVPEGCRRVALSIEGV